MASSEVREAGARLGSALSTKVGEIAYKAYAQKANHLTYDGKAMPTWQDLGDDVRSRWTAAGQMVSLMTMKTISEAGRRFQG